MSRSSRGGQAHRRSLTTRLQHIALEVVDKNHPSQFGAATASLEGLVPAEGSFLDLATANRMRLILLGVLKSTISLQDDVQDCYKGVHHKLVQRAEATIHPAVASPGIVSSLPDSYVLSSVKPSKGKAQHSSQASSNGSLEEKKGKKKPAQKKDTEGNAVASAPSGLVPAAAAAPKKRKRAPGNANGGSKAKAKKPPSLPPWVARIPQPGDRVVAKIAEHLWILAHVKSFDPKEKTYWIVDDDDSNNQRHVRPDCVLNLPRSGEGKVSIFTVGSKVMAMYPQTTTFYLATVAPPVQEKGKPATHVALRFEDDDEDALGHTQVKMIPVEYVSMPPKSPIKHP